MSSALSDEVARFLKELPLALRRKIRDVITDPSAVDGNILLFLSGLSDAQRREITQYFTTGGTVDIDGLALESNGAAGVSCANLHDLHAVATTDRFPCDSPPTKRSRFCDSAKGSLGAAFGNPAEPTSIKNLDYSFGPPSSSNAIRQSTGISIGVDNWIGSLGSQTANDIKNGVILCDQEEVDSKRRQKLKFALSMCNEYYPVLRRDRYLNAVVLRRKLRDSMIEFGSPVTQLTFRSKTIEFLMVSRELVSIPREKEIFSKLLGRCYADDSIVITFTGKYGSQFACDGPLWANFFKDCYEVNITGSPCAVELSTLVPNLQGRSLYLDLITSVDVTLRTIAPWIPSVVTDFRFDARYTSQPNFIDNVTSLFSEVVLRENPRRQLAGLPLIGFQNLTLVVSDFAIGDCLPYACQRLKRTITHGESHILVLTEQSGDNKIADQISLLGFRYHHQGVFPNLKNVQKLYDYWKDDQEKYIMFGFRSID